MLHEDGRPLGVFVGLATLDVVHRVVHHAGPDEKVTAIGQDIAAGGPAANAAVTFAALGGRALLVTALGAHQLAHVIADELRSRDVRVVDVDPDDPEPPAVSAIAVDDATGARSVTSVDASARQVPGPAPSQWSRLLAGAAVVLLDGHHPLLAVPAALAAVGAGVPVVLDAGRWKPVMQTLVPLADDVICSADFRWPGSPDAATSAAGILGASGTPRAVAVTNGAAPVRWWHGEASGDIAVPQVAAVDTLGAGDAFHGAYAFLRTEQQLTFPQRLAGAAGVAALRVSVQGPRGWLAHLADRSADLGADREADRRQR